MKQMLRLNPVTGKYEYDLSSMIMSRSPEQTYPDEPPAQEPANYVEDPQAATGEVDPSKGWNLDNDTLVSAAAALGSGLMDSAKSRDPYVVATALGSKANVDYKSPYAQGRAGYTPRLMPFIRR